MKFAVLAIVLLVAVCCPVQSEEDESVKDMLKNIGKALAHGITSKIKGFFGAIKQLVKSKDGMFTIDGTPLVLSFHAHRCKIKFGRKRMLIGTHVKCTAVVTDKFTGIQRTCTTNKQMSAVECAARLVLEAARMRIEMYPHNLL